MPYREAVALMGAPDAYESLIRMFVLDEEGELVLHDPRSHSSNSMSDKAAPQQGRKSQKALNSTSPVPRTTSAQATHA